MNFFKAPVIGRKDVFLGYRTMDRHSTEFISALERCDIKGIRAVPKSDLHNHAALGSRFKKLLQWHGSQITAPPAKFDGINGMDAYLREALSPVLLSRDGFEYAIKAAFEQAADDGVNVLEMSIDIWFAWFYGGSAEAMTQFVRQTAERFSQIHFIPQIGFNREADGTHVIKGITAFFETGYYRSLDLYGVESACGPEDFKDVFIEARKAGLRLKAHAGEFGDAESVRHAVEVLDLDEVQHGIGAAQSKEVMQWLRERGTQLNVCPSSNVALGIVPDLKEHPIRILVDNGVKVTINTDDLMLFGQSVSEEYLNVYNASLLSAMELDEIRKTGLKELEFNN